MPGRAFPIDAETAVVYEGDRVDAGSVAAALRRAGGAAPVHLAADDAVRPAMPGVRWQTFPSTRSGAFRDYAVERVEALLAAAGDVTGLRDALTVRGVDTAQVAIIDWAHRAGEALLKEWICERIVKAGVTRVIWVPADGTHPRDCAADICALLRERGVDATPLAPARLSSVRFATRRFNNSAAAILQYARGRRQSRPAVPAHASAPRVLFAENYPKTSKLSAVIARTIEAAGATEVWFVVTRRDTEAALRSFGLRRLVHLDDLAARSTWAESLAAQRRAVRAARSGWLADRAPFLGEQFAIVTEAQWRHAAHMTALWSDAMAALRPDVVATTSQANVFARAAVAAAHRTGASSFLIQHGLLGHDRFESRVSTERQLLWGEWDRRQRIALGFDPAMLTATGSPTIEPLLANREAPENPWTPASTLKVLYVPTLTTGQWMSPAASAAQRDIVASAVRAIPGAELVIKVHPSEPSEMFAAAAARVFRDGTAAQLIPHADVVVCSTSTSGLEACAMDKPVVLLRAEGVRTFRQYEEHGAVLFASDETTLRERLVAVGRDASLREELRRARVTMNDDLFFGLRPGATDRMAAAIRECAVARHHAPRAELSRAV